MTITERPVTRGAIRNPVLRGFHPDPSILRVGTDYYLATSTFEWYPGVRLHHSRDLVHWRPLGGALDERRLLDLTGVPDSGGVWAPALSHVGGRFHLVFTNVAAYSGAGFWDTPNAVVTAPAIEGPWSDPVPLHALGFDPSLFHDDDGRSWLLSMVTDWRPGHSAFNGICLQEYDRATCRLVGDPVQVFAGTAAGCTEAPHLYRRDGWYHLVVAEGGTGWEHQVTVARSRRITGPYVPDPAGPTLSSHGDPGLVLQKAGHASLVSTPADEWFLAHLVGRPLTPRGPCVLGRETALQRIRWTEDGWPRVDGGYPRQEVPAPDLEPHPWPPDPVEDRFTGPGLGPHWSTLRRPADPSWLSLTERPGHLRLRGGQSPQSRRAPSLVARRVEHARAAAETVVEADPTSYRQLAGLTAYYNSRNWHYVHVGHDESLGRCVRVLSCDRGRLLPGPVVPLAPGPVRLRAELDGRRLRFGHGPPGGDLAWLPASLDAGILSDEHATERVDGRTEVWGFTGAFFGLWAHDLSGAARPADFGGFSYAEL